MKRDEERLAQLHATLVDRVQQVTSGEEWTRFLVESSRFHRYSPTNRMLIVAQLLERGIDPDGLTASYKTWQRVPAQDGGTCQVRRGEQALWIYAPMTITRRETDERTGEERLVAAGVRGFKAVPVFHQSQLASPPDLAEPPTPELLRGDDAPARVWDAIAAELVAAGYSVDVVARQPGESWNGRTDFAAREVLVHADLDAPQRLKTLAHEWAHVALDHASATTGQARHVAEVEAESVAYLLMAAVDIDAAGYTIPYVTGWAGGNVDTIRATAERVIATSAALIDRLEERLGVDLTPDPIRATPPPAPQPAEPAEREPVVADRLLAPERAELLDKPAPERLAYLLASAGLDATQAVQTFRELGIDNTVATTALTAIYPYSDDVDLPASSLYSPAEVRAASRGPSGAAGEGLKLIDQWDAIETSPSHPRIEIGMPGAPR